MSIYSILISIGAMSTLNIGAQKRPNIIYIMCDDMGYGDLGCYGQQLISTPNIDRMAAEGMRFTQAYAGSPVSAPSRATFMTGQHTGHTHVRGNKEYWSDRPMVTYGKCQDFDLVGQEPYDPHQVIIPEIFKENGYKTAMFGKWAGGYEGSASTPDKRGIDDFYGYICQYQAHLYYPNFLNQYSRSNGDKGTQRIVLKENIKYPMYGPQYINRSQYSSDLIHQKALLWLEKQKQDEPFLGIFTYTLPHAELRQPNDSIFKAYKGKFHKEKQFNGYKLGRYNPTNYGHAEFAAMITRLDTQVGQILDKLKQKGLDKNTIVIFTSDNGPHEEGGADPSFFNRDGLLKGIKRSIHEGGIRIPFIVWAPKIIEGGTVNHHPFAFYDLLPTFCDLAQINDYRQQHPNSSFDGISIAPTLLGKGKQPIHDHLYWEFHETDMIGVRKGNWKLIIKKGRPFLYNLTIDIHEDNDLSKKYPEIVQQMIDIVKKEHNESPIFKVTLPY